MKNYLKLFLLLALCSLFAEAQIPRTLSYQGVLTDSAGTPRADDNYNFTFSLYDSGSGGKSLWTEGKPLATKRGLFSTALGDVTPFPDSLRFDRPYWLNISVSGIGELTPRVPLTSVGYSMNALRADTANVALQSSGWSRTDSSIFFLNGNVGIGTLVPNEILTVKGRISMMGNDPNASGGRIFLVEEIPSNFPRSGASGFRMAAAYPHLDGYAGHPLANVIKYDGNTIVCTDALGNSLGYVGIGTPDPNERLTVRGDLSLMSTVDPARSGGKIFHLREAPSYNPPTGATGFRITAAFPYPNGYNSGPSADVIRYDGNTILGTDINGNQLGNVGIGTTNPTEKLEVAGRTKTEILEITGGSDLAEPFEMSHEQILEPGSVVIIDDEHPGQLKLSDRAYDRRVAGVVSGAGGIKPGLTLKQEGLMEGNQNVALSGRVYVKATAANGPIKPGDRLVTSSVPGLCMRATDPSRCDGAVIGKAMSALSSGEGLVLLLINLQ